MATLEVAAKGDPTLAVPALVLIKHLEISGNSQQINTAYHDERTLPGVNCSIRLTAVDGTTLVDRAAIGELVDTVSRVPPQIPLLVSATWLG
jgi:hypothetical protein